jgi:hypothetical protein
MFETTMSNFEREAWIVLKDVKANFWEITGTRITKTS